MHLRPRHRVPESRLGTFSLSVVLLLCLCVFLQVLGAPVTLLNPVEAADTLATSVSEGFSLPSSLPVPAIAVSALSVADVPPSVHVPILASALFHPPVP